MLDEQTLGFADYRGNRQYLTLGAIADDDRVALFLMDYPRRRPEGLSRAWSPYQAYWEKPSDAARNAVRTALTPDAIRTQYLKGADASLVAPDGYTLDIAYFAREGTDEIQLDLIYDYRTNVELSDAWQAYFRKHKPPLLAVWGEKDIYFLPPGANAFRRDIPDAEIRFYPTGHFALETHGAEIGDHDARVPGPQGPELTDEPAHRDRCRPCASDNGARFSLMTSFFPVTL